VKKTGGGKAGKIRPLMRAGKRGDAVHVVLEGEGMTIREKKGSKRDEEKGRKGRENSPSKKKN